uniref:Transmembrane 9 superfamily member n=1 Tax=Albugo laibachii Nc14 TaxID=890382 RepID=F0WMV8_9STRA|nr:endomembrane protein 70like protein putative [Albugo laibachii Nc14]|eukprot:CCA22643.1 endomembrane protein 70like protein putative [Albugo laibachii Nc14]
MRLSVRTWLVCTLLSVQTDAAFYIPGVAPESWADGESIKLEVNKITSTNTLVPYEYYYLPFCAPLSTNEQHENLGEIMAGDAIMDSLYIIEMNKNTQCRVLCKPRVYTVQESMEFTNKIEDEYYAQWIVDNLPVLYSSPFDTVATTDSQTNYRRGYPIGEIDENGYMLNNHVRITLLINEDPYVTDTNAMKWRIVGFEVVPTSIEHDFAKDPVPGEELDPAVCGAHGSPESRQYLSSEKPTKVLYTYDVHFVKSDILWEERWDRIISSKSSNDRIHWFAIVNSSMIVLFLTGMVAMIMLRALHRDIMKYNEVATSEDAQEETGWKLVHGDVFRPPLYSPILFSVTVGSGVQVCCMSGSTMVIALLGLLSPANRGSLLTTLLLLFVFMGSFAGYFSSRTYKMFHGKDWKRNTLMTALLYPGIMFSIFFVLNTFLWGKHSSQSIPFGTLFALLVLWFGVSVPLVFLGSYFGFKAPAIEHPVRTNQIARQIPEQVWYLSPPFSILVGGILPFGAVFIELFFIMSALWLHQIYYVFGFLFLVVLILIATCAEVAIVLCYFHLCAEDHRWWWNSFLTSGAAAIYLFLYSILYFMTKLNITSFISGLLYFGYMGMISITFFFMTGTIGFFACFWFTRRIYSSIRID